VKEKDILHDLETNIFCRLRPSRRHGVGVFAIRNISKGINPFRGLRNTIWLSIPAKKIEKNQRITSEVKEMVQQFYVRDKDVIFMPNQSLNEIDISFFINHSKKPNLLARNNGEEFITARHIQKGEELTVNYHTYCS
jgi:SET domain-containing protein